MLKRKNCLPGGSPKEMGSLNSASVLECLRFLGEFEAPLWKPLLQQLSVYQTRRPETATSRMLGSGQSETNLGIVDYCIVGFIHDLQKGKKTFDQTQS